RALVMLGDSAVEALADRLGDSKGSLACRKQIPEALLRIGTPLACRALAENLVQADGALRSKVISALNKLTEFLPDFRVDRELVESAMVAEMMGHYRSYQIWGTSNGDADGALKETMTEELERIFRLMKLRFPTLDLQNAYLGIRSSDPVTHAN